MSVSYVRSIDIDCECLSSLHRPIPSSSPTIVRHDTTWQSVCARHHEDVSDVRWNDDDDNDDHDDDDDGGGGGGVRGIHEYFYPRPCTRVHGRAGAESCAYACTPTLHALSDGTDIRLRCQPIVKGTIRVGHIGQVGPLLVVLFPYLSSSLLWSPVMPLAYECAKMIDIYRHSLISTVSFNKRHFLVSYLQKNVT